MLPNSTLNMVQPMNTPTKQPLAQRVLSASILILPAAGMISTTNANGSDFHQLNGSPVIDEGNNAYAPMPVDLDGKLRIHDSIVDMGCYEFIPEPGFYLLIIIYNLLFINRWRKLKS